MNADKKTDEKSQNPNKQNPLIRKIAIYAAAILVAFMLGFVPMWMTARERATNLAETQRQLKVAQMQNLLALAVIDAHRAEYEPARQSASGFFTNLRAEIERESNSVLTQMQRERVNPLFAQRDEIITLLSRSDPASADRLSNFYVSYRKAIGDS